MKTCNAEYCQYKTCGGTMPGCTYEGYCDYQTPRDSRMEPILPYLPPTFGPPPGMGESCPECHLPYTMCPGHSTCLGDLDG